MAITSSMNSVCMQTIVDMFGIDPFKFNCLYPLCIDYNESGCEEFWTQYFEHGNLISREELAMELYRAELEVASYLGTFPFETYVCDESIEIEPCYRSSNVLGVPLSEYEFHTKWGCVTDFGVFENEILGQAAIEYIDDDGDGIHELAKVTFDYSAVTTSFNIAELILLFPGFYRYNNVVCPILSVENDTATDIITFYVNSWNLVKPELYLHRSFVETTALDACDLDNYVTVLDVCIKNKTCKPDGWVYFNAIDGCSGGNCEEVAYPFCALAVDSSLATFKIQVGSVDTDGCFISGANCAPCTTPTRIEVNYTTGCKSCLSTKKNISFCNLIERAIIYIAVARLPRSLCECGCSTQYIEELKFDTSITYSGTDVKFNYPSKLRNMNPFGTKIGELEGYKILQNIENNLC